ncbi:MAG TPA: putative quinol monooxygenase [Phycisphaerae bacterium]|nr:antibiotic biosynthesis monooxygenase [Phycisphaerales bacterium]HRX83803.1 putative quinol monooxygenase [Phycisphaerae bacterium]
MQRLTVLALMRAQPGKSEELGQRLMTLLESSRREAGCINYDVHRANEDTDAWCVYENWRSPQDLEAHFETPAFREFVARAPGLLAGDVDLRKYTMVSMPQSSA